jgi:hypothetical protein
MRLDRCGAEDVLEVTIVEQRLQLGTRDWDGAVHGENPDDFVVVLLVRQGAGEHRLVAPAALDLGDAEAVPLLRL